MNYRKIYESFHGPIPKEPNGRTYDIHHLDGNHSNNDPTNLKAVTIREHYDIHYSQSDWMACHKLGPRMEMSPTEISRLASLAVQKRVSEGTHHWQKRADGTSVSFDRVAEGKHHLQKRPDGTSFTSDRVKEGKHHFQKRADGTSVASDLVAAGKHHLQNSEKQREKSLKKVAAGKHNLQKRADGTSVASDLVTLGKHHLQKRPDGTSLASDNVKNGTHPTQKYWKCEHCGKEGKGLGGYAHWHGNNCKMVSA